MPLPPPAPLRQRGITLISLMTGLAISMVLVLATLMLFQRMVRATTAARMDAQADAQRTAAFLSAGIAAQDAGYGIDAAQVGTHLVVLKDAKLTGSTLSGTQVSSTQDSPDNIGNAVVWAENAMGTQRRCSALLAPNESGQGGQPKEGGLRKLGPVTCADAAAFSALAWTALPLWTALPVSDEDDPLKPVAITWRPVACTPFGIAAGTGALKVLLTLTAANSNGVVLETSQCLANVSTP